MLHEDFLALSIEKRIQAIKHDPALLCPVLERWHSYAVDENYGETVGFSDLGKPARWLDYYALTETLEAWLDVQGMTGAKEIRDYYRAIMAIYDPGNPIFGKRVPSREIPALWTLAFDVTVRIKNRIRGMILENSQARNSQELNFTEAGYFSYKQIALKHGLSADALRHRLATWRKTHADGYKENTDRRQNEGKFLYTEAAIKSVIDSMKSRLAKRAQQGKIESGKPSKARTPIAGRKPPAKPPAKKI